MTPNETDTILKFLIDKLGPDDKADLQQLLGGNELPSLASDAKRGRIAMDRLPERIKRRVLAEFRPVGSSAQDAAFAARFPGAARIGRL